MIKKKMEIFALDSLKNQFREQEILDKREMFGSVQRRRIGTRKLKRDNPKIPIIYCEPNKVKRIKARIQENWDFANRIINRFNMNFKIGMRLQVIYDGRKFRGMLNSISVYESEEKQPLMIILDQTYDEYKEFVNELYRKYPYRTDKKLILSHYSETYSVILRETSIQKIEKLFF